MMINTPTVLGSSSTLEVADTKRASLEQIDVKKRILSSPRPHPSVPSSGGSSGGSSGSSSSGGSSGGGSSSGGSSGGSSSGGGSSGGGAAAANASNLASHNAQKGVGLMLGIAAVAGMVIAAVVIPRRKTATEAKHPLKGSLNKRIDLFANLAKHTSSAERPPRRDEEGRYINADSIV